MTSVRVYTDGACRGNPGPGGWGVRLEAAAGWRELWGGESGTTNNRMELLAAIEALASLRSRCRVDLYTDSEYVRRGITEWISRWKRNGWRTSDRKPVKNSDLWVRLDELSAGHEVAWHWVRGHAGDPGNERADELANRGLDAAVAAGGPCRHEARGAPAGVA
jgi:ribonuclease HI